MLFLDISRGRNVNFAKFEGLKYSILNFDASESFMIFEILIQPLSGYKYIHFGQG